MRLLAPVVLYMAFIFVLSSISRPVDLPPGMSDKGGHLLLYAGLGVLVARALAGGWRGPMTIRLWLATVVICTLYGISDEVHQSFVPPREAELFDVAADAIGASLGGVAMALLARRL